jgi:hypothetical protein
MPVFQAALMAARLNHLHLDALLFRLAVHCLGFDSAYLESVVVGDCSYWGGGISLTNSAYA